MRMGFCGQRTSSSAMEGLAPKKAWRQTKLDTKTRHRRPMVIPSQKTKPEEYSPGFNVPAMAYIRSETGAAADFIHECAPQDPDIRNHRDVADIVEIMLDT